VRIGILTGGGDCPGLNAVIRSVVRTATTHYDSEVLGFRDGWRGLLEDRTTPLDVAAVDGLLTRGGTTLGSARVAPEKLHAGLAQMKGVLAAHGVDVLIPIGGEGTLTAAHLLAQAGVPVVGIPKTIDNDIDGTDLTFGFDTAVSIATDLIDRLHTTAESHQRVLLVEVMGRHAGWIALHAGLASGAHLTLVPEEPFDIEEVCEAIRRRHGRGRYASIVVVAEGAQPVEGSLTLADGEVDAFGHVRLGGIANVLATEIEARTGYETRVTILGHVQRGGTPTAYDRVLATRFGIAAIDAVHDGAFGSMVALRADSIVRVPLAEAVGELKLIDPQLHHGVADVFFG
jgi:ATP-dependent phosphofructokinase / diphosphate-dependent phosphofructokinase